ncbi:MAG TPA: hypothetical protein VNF99_00240, partial [Stellaceae bacterium]|nr:hypothetical protein [Stellaceae bacterium]
MLRPASAVVNLAQLWRDLEARAEISFFLSWDWIGRWLAETEIAPLLLSASAGDRIVALALFRPARLRRHFFVRPRAWLLHQTGDPDFDAITIEHNGILVDCGFRDGAIRGCLAHLMSSAAWDEAHFGGVADSFAAQLGRSGLGTWTRWRQPSWIVDLDAVRQSGRPYLETL